MKTCIIFCAAGFDGLLAPIPEDALVIAADGGLRHAEGLGLRPDVIFTSGLFFKMVIVCQFCIEKLLVL